MTLATRRIEETISNLFTKLKAIEVQVIEQEENIAKQKSGLLGMTEASSELMNATRATRTAIELLREGIEEVHQIMMALCAESNKEKSNQRKNSEKENNEEENNK